DDSALVLTERALTGAGLSLSDSEPRLGEEIAILGFPLHTYDLRISRGVISGLREQVSYPNGISANSAYVTDAAINGGNSGGPVVNSRGQVVGLVTGKRLWVSGGNPGEGAVEGTGYVVPSLLLSTNLTRWVAQPLAAVPTCAGDEEPPADDGGMLQVTLRTADPLAAELARSLALHGEAINRGSYSAAWEIFTPAMQRRMKDMNQWKAGLETSLWTALDVVDVSSTGSRADARVVLQTVQDRAFGYQGQTCSLWSSRYTMVNSSGGWLIDAVDAGRGPTPC
ncbi:MAG: trypsin-like peptidase domain-containing protein, partial [Actinomycetes bacterium]